MKADDKDGFAGLAPSPELQEWLVFRDFAELFRLRPNAFGVKSLNKYNAKYNTMLSGVKVIV